MEYAALCFIILLVIIVLILMIYNYSIHKKVDTFSNLNQRVTNLNVLQDFMNTLGDSLSIDEKIERINDVLINKYSIKYSTIVVFNGAEYEVKASNVEEKHWDTLKNLQSDPVFADSIKTAVPKYITVENDSEKLPYQKMEFGRAKCAMFFPLYIDNVYIGYWIIEGSRPHEFDNMDTTILEVVRKNIVTILKTVQSQQTLENLVRNDQFSGLKSAEYLYGEGKKIIDKSTTSAICLFKIVNLPEINEEIGRKTGNDVVTEISSFVKNNLSTEYVFVRYMGPKFAIVFSGVETKGAFEFMKSLKLQMEALNIQANLQDVNNFANFASEQPNNNYTGNTNNIIDNGSEDVIYNNKTEQQVSVKPKIRVVVATYYKGTSLDGAFKKIEEFIDKSDENSITQV